MAIALDRIAYFGERLSENIAKTPEGYLICRNAVIGRTGFQTYKVAELSDPDGELARNYSPSDEIEVWRDAAEVFSRITIASFEGKSFTLTHPPELLDPQNTAEHDEGHMQNVRQGGPLSDGNISLIADIIVKGPAAIRAIETGERELSCGYTYRLFRNGNRWEQREIQGNHVALVQKGRAGESARINDAVPKESTMSISLKNFVAQGLKLFAKDASPEQLSEALSSPEIAKVMQGESVIATRSTAVDANPAPTSIRILETAPVKKVTAAAGKYIEIDGQHFKLVALDDDDKVKGKDNEHEREGMDDAKKKLHDALDALFQSHSSGGDAGFDTFKKQLDAYIEGGSKATDDDKDDKEDKEEHGKDDDKNKGKDKVDEHELAEMDDEPEDKENKEEEERKGKDADIVRPEPVLAAGEVPGNALDAAQLRVIVADANLTILKMLRPFVAKANDSALNAAFNTAVKQLKAVTKKDAGTTRNGYIDFTAAASALSSKANDSKELKPRETESEKRTKEADAVYAGVMKKTGTPFSTRMKERTGA